LRTNKIPGPDAYYENTVPRIGNWETRSSIRTKISYLYNIKPENRHVRMACVSRLRTYPRLRGFGSHTHARGTSTEHGHAERALSLCPYTVQRDSTDFPKYARQHKHNWEGERCVILVAVLNTSPSLRQKLAILPGYVWSQRDPGVVFLCGFVRDELIDCRIRALDPTKDDEDESTMPMKAPGRIKGLCGGLVRNSRSHMMLSADVSGAEMFGGWKSPPVKAKSILYVSIDPGSVGTAAERSASIPVELEEWPGPAS
jgi:hypothetical protein